MANENQEDAGTGGGEDKEGLLENPLLAALSSPEAKPDGEDEEHDDGNEVSVDVLKDRLKARNRTLSQRDKAIERMQVEIRELQNKPSTQLTPELIAALRHNGEPQKPDNRIEELKQRVSDDPSSAVEIMMEAIQNQEARFVDVLRRRDAALRKENKAPLSEDVSKVVNALKGLPEYEGFSDEQLETVAKTVSPVVKKATRPPAPLTSGGARRVSANASEKETLAAYAEELRQMGYEL